MERPLSALTLGERAYISRLGNGTDLSRRLAQLGFVPGTQVDCELIAPAGDPSAYRVRGALIALRREDARQIYVQQEKEAPVECE